MAATTTMYDVIIVGAGISGMNSAYILKKRCKNIKILILEAKGVYFKKRNVVLESVELNKCYYFLRSRWWTNAYY